jgi:hypothetical protein
VYAPCLRLFIENRFNENRFDGNRFNKDRFNDDRLSGDCAVRSTAAGLLFQHRTLLFLSLPSAPALLADASPEFNPTGTWHC